MEQSVKTHKRKSKNLVDPGDLVSEKSLEKVYTILGKVIIHIVLPLYHEFSALPKIWQVLACNMKLGAPTHSPHHF